MFGCVAYTLCFFKHPFQDSQKLGIVNAYYNFPEEPKGRISEKMRDFIRNMLTPDPSLRPSIAQIACTLENWDKIDTVKLNVSEKRRLYEQEEAKKVKERQTKKVSTVKKSGEEDRKFDRDLTPEDIARLQEKISQEQAAKAKPYQKSALIDWQGAGSGADKQEFFEKEKKEVAKKEASSDYFNSDFF